MLTAHLFISGFVQGVGFRHFVRAKALEHGLTGWVRNAPDGRVEAVLQSSASSDQEGKAKIEDAIKACKKGPFLSEVENVEVQWEDSKTRFEDFEIVV